MPQTTIDNLCGTVELVPKGRVTAAGANTISHAFVVTSMTAYTFDGCSATSLLTTIEVYTKSMVKICGCSANMCSQSCSAGQGRKIRCSLHAGDYLLVAGVSGASGVTKEFITSTCSSLSSVVSIGQFPAASVSPMVSDGASFAHFEGIGDWVVPFTVSGERNMNLDTRFIIAPVAVVSTLEHASKNVLCSVRADADRLQCNLAAGDYYLIFANVTLTPTLSPCPVTFTALVGPTIGTNQRFFFSFADMYYSPLSSTGTNRNFFSSASSSASPTLIYSFVQSIPIVIPTGASFVSFRPIGALSLLNVLDKSGYRVCYGEMPLQPSDTDGTTFVFTPSLIVTFTPTSGTYVIGLRINVDDPLTITVQDGATVICTLILTPSTDDQYLTCGTVVTVTGMISVASSIPSTTDGQITMARYTTTAGGTTAGAECELSAGSYTAYLGFKRLRTPFAIDIAVTASSSQHLVANRRVTYARPVRVSGTNTAPFYDVSYPYNGLTSFTYKPNSAGAAFVYFLPSGTAYFRYYTDPLSPGTAAPVPALTATEFDMCSLSTPFTFPALTAGQSVTFGFDAPQGVTLYEFVIGWYFGASTSISHQITQLGTSSIATVCSTTSILTRQGYSSYFRCLLRRGRYALVVSSSAAVTGGVVRVKCALKYNDICGTRLSMKSTLNGTTDGVGLSFPFELYFPKVLEITTCESSYDTHLTVLQASTGSKVCETKKGGPACGNKAEMTCRLPAGNYTLLVSDDSPFRVGGDLVLQTICSLFNDATCPGISTSAINTDDLSTIFRVPVLLSELTTLTVMSCGLDSYTVATTSITDMNGIQICGVVSTPCQKFYCKLHPGSYFAVVTPSGPSLNHKITLWLNSSFHELPENIYPSLFFIDTSLRKIFSTSRSGCQLKEWVKLGAYSDPAFLQVDTVASQIFWADRGTGEIWRANLKGNARPRRVLGGVENPRYLKLDVAMRNAFFVHDSYTSLTRNVHVVGVDVDETSAGYGVIDRITPGGNPFVDYGYLQFDASMKFIFWLDSNRGELFWCPIRNGPSAYNAFFQNLRNGYFDATDPVTGQRIQYPRRPEYLQIVKDTSTPLLDNSWIFFFDTYTYRLYTLKFDPLTGILSMFTTPAPPAPLIDIPALLYAPRNLKILYDGQTRAALWTDTSNSTWGGHFQAATLSGTSTTMTAGSTATVFVNSLIAEPSQLEVENLDSIHTSRQVYWSDRATGNIFRATIASQLVVTNLLPMYSQGLVSPDYLQIFQGPPKTVTRSPTPTTSSSRTQSTTVVDTYTPSPSKTPSRSPTVSSSTTFSRSDSRTRTKTPTPTKTKTFTPSTLGTATTSSTASLTDTKTQTLTITSTVTRTPTPSASSTTTITATSSPSPSPTITPSLTISSTPSGTDSVLLTSTLTASKTPTPTIPPENWKPEIRVAAHTFTTFENRWGDIPKVTYVDRDFMGPNKTNDTAIINNIFVTINLTVAYGELSFGQTTYGVRVRTVNITAGSHGRTMDDTRSRTKRGIGVTGVYPIERQYILQGRAREMNKVLQQVKYRSAQDFNGVDLIELWAFDNGLNRMGPKHAWNRINITVLPWNTPPAIKAPRFTSVKIQRSVRIPIKLEDPDINNGTLTVRLSVSHGLISVILPAMQCIPLIDRKDACWQIIKPPPNVNPPRFTPPENVSHIEFTAPLVLANEILDSLIYKNTDKHLRNVPVDPARDFDGLDIWVSDNTRGVPPGVQNSTFHTNITIISDVFMSCAQFLDANPKYCGCYYQTQHKPLIWSVIDPSTPLELLYGLEDPYRFKMGCCQTVWLEDHYFDVEGQLGLCSWSTVT